MLPLCYSPSTEMALVQQNILTAFQELGANVSVVLRAHQGNTARINEQKRSCLQFLANIQQVFCEQIYRYTDNLLNSFSSIFQI